MIQKSEHLGRSRLDSRNFLQRAGEIAMLEQAGCTLAMFMDQRVRPIERGKGAVTLHLARAVAVIPFPRRQE